MATERFDHPALTRLSSISDELSAMNTLIIANVTELPQKLELVDQLLLRCDEMLAELHAIRAIYAAKAGNNSESSGPSSGTAGNLL